MAATYLRVLRSLTFRIDDRNTFAHPRTVHAYLISASSHREAGHPPRARAAAETRNLRNFPDTRETEGNE